MTRSITLVGLDCGSTTTSAVVARARLAAGAVGRMEMAEIEPVFRSELVFTPLRGESIDAARLERYLDQWLGAAGTAPADIFGGGALITGLAAQRDNAAAIARLIERRLADSLVAAADDPRLESWLAFMGNCQALSRAHPQLPILNLDIGGGTTNLALGRDGQVLATGCLFVGARHFQFTPGTFCLTGLSSYAVALLEHLRIDKHEGDTLQPSEIDAILNAYLEWIEAAIGAEVRQAPTSPIAQRHLQVPLDEAGSELPQAAITLSGGVSQLVYDRLRGQPCGGPTRFGDLGCELAERIAHSPAIVARMGSLVPPGLGRATVLGLLEHGTELSGSTLYLPRPELLPLANVPIVGRIDAASTTSQLARALELAGRAAPAGCVRVDVATDDLKSLRRLATGISDTLTRQPLPSDWTLVLLVSGNLGKVLGNYITRWGTLEMNLIVVDEVAQRPAQFVRLGRLNEGIVPLSLYGMR